MRHVRRAGDNALLVDVDEHDVDGLARALRLSGQPGVVEVVAGASSVLVALTPYADRAAVSTLLATVEPLTRTPATVELVTLDVRYDGADLDDVAALTGLSRADVVRRHTAAQYEVAFCGFSPGFAYLRGLDPALRVPRLDSPRTHVAAGSVAVADRWSAVYPRESPGGWRLLGTTDASLWDLGRTRPALLTDGMTVRFREAAS